ncbi:MAG TPA: ATP-dependent DNA helicase UvrD2 [Acidimicrobiia bacterium]|nr:ATP-dependent DNA helicase UvrD2 [Acidimicrobiia bacterium]
MTFPGPEALGRGVVVLPGAAPPPPFRDAPRVVVDDAVLASPAATAAAAALLHESWEGRRRVVVELGAPVEVLRAPEVERRPPYELDPGFTFDRERLQFLVWANTYDARKAGEPVWWHGVRASRIGAALGGPADVVLADGTPAWCDGGPRRPLPITDAAVIHRDSVDAGLLTTARFSPPAAELAADQLAAVAHPGGPARIIAPAGSGKTRVLTERIRHLLLDRGYEPGLVTAVAYNVMAAEQLRERTAGFQPTIRTLNSLGLNVCSRRGQWRIAEEPYCREVLSGLVKTARKVGTDPLAPYLDALATIRLGLVPPEKAEDLHPDAAGIAAAFPAYRQALHDDGRLDFDDQIYHAVELLLADADLRAEVRAEARTLLVDEFQDLTPAHLLLIRLVAGPAADVFGVGDDDQVIYGYAGADPGFLIDFGTYFPGAATYDLQVNYRCPPAVVEAARTLLGHNRRRIDKTIRPSADLGTESRENRGVSCREPGGLGVQLVAGDEMGPATVELVQRWAEKGVAYSDVAILTRVNSSLLPVQLLLQEAGIPYRPAVGPWILERAGTAAALAYLRIAADPGRISRADVRATVRRPSRKISPKVIDMLARDATTSLRSIRGLAQWLADTDAFVKDAERVERYAADLEALAGAPAKPGSTTGDVLRFIRDTIGLGEAMETLDASKGVLDRSSNGDDLAALLQVAPVHPDAATFEGWLHGALAGSGGNAGADAGVHLATVHRVKGREWPRVVVFGADAGLFPHRLSADVEEERRIFHVAVTRARHEAVVLADAGGPSPFVEELHRPAPVRPAGGEPADPNPFRRLAMPPPSTAAARAGRRKDKAATGDGEPAFPAVAGAEITLGGGLRATVEEIRRGEVLVATATGSTVVGYGAAIKVDGRNVRLTAPAERAAANVAALKAWRTAMAKKEGKPPYVYLSDAHIADIAERDPDTIARLARCKGIGPGKLENYGETLLALLEDAGRPAG